MRRPLTHRAVQLLAVAITVLTLAGLSGVAYAYWRSAGQASATVSVGSMSTVTIEALVGGDAPSARLYPGGPARDVVLKVHNPNAFTVSVVSVVGNGTITGVGGTGSCAITGVTFSYPSVASITPSPTLSASSTTLLHLPGAATMSTASNNGCQGATFHIPVTLTVHR